MISKKEQNDQKADAGRKAAVAARDSANANKNYDKRREEKAIHKEKQATEQKGSFAWKKEMTPCVSMRVNLLPVDSALH